MFLRRNRKNHKGEAYDYRTPVEPVRTSRGPRQRRVATLGKLPGLDEESRMGWEHVGDIPDGAKFQARPSDSLSALPDRPEWARVSLRGVRVERLRSFGNVYPALALWRRLKLAAWCSLLSNLLNFFPCVFLCNLSF